MERVARIELAREPWQGPRLPLHHTRAGIFNPLLVGLQILVTIHDVQNHANAA